MLIANLEVIFLIVAAILVVGLIWPRGGLLGLWRRARGRSRRVQLEDALKFLQKSQLRGERPSVSALAKALRWPFNRAAALVYDMESAAWIRLQDGKIELTPTGRDYAAHIIRAHRLWEQFLAEKTGYDPAEWHAQAELQEHVLSPDALAALDSMLYYPSFDPHGDAIPTAEGEFAPQAGRPLSQIVHSGPLKIVHIEDEPVSVFHEIVETGLCPGMTIRVDKADAESVTILGDGLVQSLSPEAAENVYVVSQALWDPIEEPAGIPLNELRPGQKGRVNMISRRCRGPVRRRLLDLGITPGTEIEACLTGPGGDPKAYSVRGALIALRDDQARNIRVIPFEGS